MILSIKLKKKQLNSLITLDKGIILCVIGVLSSKKKSIPKLLTAQLHFLFLGDYEYHSKATVLKLKMVPLLQTITVAILIDFDSYNKSFL